jgi:drug/metabolite transporter (DMT)-like permease
MNQAANQRPLANHIAIALLCLLAVTFSSNHIAARFAFNEGVSVLTAVSFRSMGTVLALCLLILVTGGQFSLPALTVKRGLLVGLLVTLQSFCLYGAVALVPVGLALLVFNLFPLCFLLFNRAINKTQIAKRSWLAIPVLVIGLTLALNPFAKVMVGAQSQAAASTWLSGQALAGISLALLAAMAFGLALTLTEKWLKAIDGRVRSLLSMAVVGACAALVAALNFSMPALHWALPVTEVGWLSLIGLTLLYGVAFSGLFILVPRLNMPRNAAVMNIEPVFALVLAWALLGQTMQPTQWVGAVIVVIGIFIIAKN